MGKRNKLREAQRRAAEDAIALRLRAHTPARTEPAFINSFAEFAPAYRDRIDGYRDLALRAPEAWRCGLRVRAPEQRFLEMVRFTFTDYPIPRHLEDAWIDETPDEWQADRARGVDRPDFRLWSIIAGRGDLLYREAARPFMTRLETHHFATAPAEIASPQRAFWYAFARAENDNADIALRVARSKLVRYSVTMPFWRDAARFFAQHPMATHEINNLIDYINAARLADNGFALSGRSLPALRRRMEQWQRLSRAEVSGVRWSGHPRANARYEMCIGGRHAIWRFRQIKSSGGLVQEGQEMQHCVATWQEDCISGLVSIWSLTREDPPGTIKRCLTIELTSCGSLQTCRGFANRLPTAEENEVLRRWTADLDLWWLDQL